MSTLIKCHREACIAALRQSLRVDELVSNLITTSHRVCQNGEHEFEVEFPFDENVHTVLRVMLLLGFKVKILTVPRDTIWRKFKPDRFKPDGLSRIFKISII